MAFLRSAFISAFVTYLVVALAYSSVQLVRGTEPALSWLGMAMAAGGPLAFFGWVFTARPARSKRHPVGISVVSGLGLAITMALSWRYSNAAGAIHIWAAIALVSWVIYLRWYSPFRKRDAVALQLAHVLPVFELQGIDGNTVPSDTFLGQPVIWLFYRGNWCPFCVAQVGELAQQYKAIETAGASVVMVSPQASNKLQALASRFDVPVSFLVDKNNRAARILGILDAWGTPLGMQLLGYDSDTVLPTVVITDENGRVIYSHQTDNYRLRPEPGEFLEVLAELQG